MRSILLTTLAAAALSGCAERGWYKPGATQADFQRDTYTCEKDVRQSGYYGEGIPAQKEMMNFYGRCMGAAGWTSATREEFEKRKEGSSAAPPPNYVRKSAYSSGRATPPTGSSWPPTPREFPRDHLSEVLPEAAFNLPKISASHRQTTLRQ